MTYRQNYTFALQMAESTNVAEVAVNAWNYTRVAEICKVLNNFFESHGLSWNNCVDICTEMVEKQ